MLLYFSVNNFKSIKDELVLDMRPAPRLRRHKRHVCRSEGVPVLRSSVIYGANASGKSNVVKAIQYLKLLVAGEHQTHKGIISFPFKITDKVEPNTNFYIEFLVKGMQYVFSVTLNENNILEEFLYLVNKKNKDETCIYKRYLDDEGFYKVESDIFDSEDDESFEMFSLIKYTQKNKLFISEYVEKELYEKIKSSRIILGARVFFDFMLQVVFPDTYYSNKCDDIVDEYKANVFSKVLNGYDTGINGIITKPIVVDKIPSSLVNEAKEDLLKTGKESVSFQIEGDHIRFSFSESGDLLATKILTIRKTVEGKEIEFDLKDESDGTSRLFDLIPCIYGHDDDNDFNKVYVIDEFDRSLHPSISKDLVRKFLELAPENSQLIVTTHESCLLDNDLLRRDEIWFIQKEDDMSSHLYSLNDYATRFDSDIEKAYLKGKFGAIPNLTV